MIINSHQCIPALPSSGLTPPSVPPLSTLSIPPSSTALLTHGRMFGSSRGGCWLHGPGTHWCKLQWPHTGWTRPRPANTGQTHSPWSIAVRQINSYLEESFVIECRFMCNVFQLNVCVYQHSHWGQPWGDSQQRVPSCPTGCHSIQNSHTESYLYNLGADSLQDYSYGDTSKEMVVVCGWMHFYQCMCSCMFMME